MNILEFIGSIDLTQFDAKSAYAEFARTGGGGTYEYFRTKFNRAVSEGGAPRAQVPTQVFETPAEPEVEAPKLEIINYDDDRELPTRSGLIPTGTLFDSIASKRVTDDVKKTIIPKEDWERGGFTRKCCDVVAGMPGSGKTFSRTSLAAMAKMLDPSLRIIFISSEMRETEWVEEIHDAPILANIEVVYMLKYVGQSNYEELLFEAMSQADIWIGDSFPVWIDHIRMYHDERRSDKQVTNDLIRKINLSVEENDNCGQLINQANKDGNYKGGTVLPHMMSSMSFVKKDGTKRLMEFEKNRNNGSTTGHKVYFTKNKHTGAIEFNEEIYTATYLTVKDESASISDFLAGRAAAGESLTLEDNSASNGIESTVHEMGSGDATQEEWAELNAEFIPAHLREDDQMDLEDMIEEVEAEIIENVD